MAATRDGHYKWTLSMNKLQIRIRVKIIYSSFGSNAMSRWQSHFYT